MTSKNPLAAIAVPLISVENGYSYSPTPQVSIGIAKNTKGDLIYSIVSSNPELFQSKAYDVESNTYHLCSPSSVTAESVVPTLQLREKMPIHVWKSIWAQLRLLIIACNSKRTYLYNELRKRKLLSSYAQLTYDIEATCGCCLTNLLCFLSIVAYAITCFILPCIIFLYERCSGYGTLNTFRERMQLFMQEHPECCTDVIDNNLKREMDVYAAQLNSQYGHLFRVRVHTGVEEVDEGSGRSHTEDQFMLQFFVAG